MRGASSREHHIWGNIGECPAPRSRTRPESSTGLAFSPRIELQQLRWRMLLEEDRPLKMLITWFDGTSSSPARYGCKQDLGMRLANLQTLLHASSLQRALVRVIMCGNLSTYVAYVPTPLPIHLAHRNLSWRLSSMYNSLEVSLPHPNAAYISYISWEAPTPTTVDSSDIYRRTRSFPS